MSKNFDAKKFLKEMLENYYVLNNEYRNEYFYKNTIFNKLVLGRYRLSTTVAFSEINVGKSKADFVLLNKNKGIVFEIKTDLDNLDRLVSQVIDYSNVFSEIYVVTSEQNYYPVYRVLKEANISVGIIVVKKNGALSKRKLALINDNNLNHETLFKLLRKKEYEGIIIEKFKHLPQVKPVEYYKAALNLFKQIEIKEAQKLVFKQLRCRNFLKQDQLIKMVPYEIRWLVYKELSNEEELIQVIKKLEEFKCISQ